MERTTIHRYFVVSADRANFRWTVALRMFAGDNVFCGTTRTLHHAGEGPCCGGDFGRRITCGCDVCKTANARDLQRQSLAEQADGASRGSSYNRPLAIPVS